MTGTLFLIPNTLGESQLSGVIPTDVSVVASSIKHFIAEDERTVRRYLKKLNREIVIDELTFFILNKHTRSEEINTFITPLLNGFNMGLVSEAGCPGIADPGAVIVSLAHEKNIRVAPMVGPSSILLAMMASGFNGQNFAFNGYLPVKNPERDKKIKELERKAVVENQSQIFMETPYRNLKFLEEILSVCNSETLLFIGCDLTLPTEFLRTDTVSFWRKNMPDIHNRPVIFILGKKQ
ncbi:MAG: SAM-dependent methyltransferase [Bacteroidetes bacterium GWF2_38_335]|nr:MAG: SAM-dependent methyltransferase [Bacteroidetes bacterium GWF2_38_335]OFY79484.1 MAG: SAM-dependent methyltransferase [Bacteroidetes bacterium RIFOXYA12_FULL_38_20]HBS86579.1 SAM-dependent methyltransferase [Bacteroidales bacterium]